MIKLETTINNMNINIEPGKYGYKIIALLIAIFSSKKRLQKISGFLQDIEPSPKPPSPKKKKVNNNSS